MMLHHLSSAVLSKLVWDKFLVDNPNLKLGELMTSPIAIGGNGKFNSDGIGYNLIAKTVKIPYDANGIIGSLSIGDDACKWLYPYEVSVSPHLDDLDKQIGDPYFTRDPNTFKLIESVVTREFLSACHVVLVRFALEPQGN